MYNSRHEPAPAGVAKGTLIMTMRGLIPAEDVRCGDLLLTGDGTWKQVEQVCKQTAPTIVLKGDGRELECTASQEIVCAEEPGQDAKWTDAGAAVSHWWLSPATVEAIPFPVPPDRTLLNENVFEIAGAYIGAGVQGSGRPVDIRCTGGTAARLQEVIQRVTLDWTYREDAQSGRLQISNDGLCEWLRDCFGAAPGTLPAWTLGIPEEWRTALWKGISESGARTGENETCVVTTPDETAALMMLLFAQTLNMQGAMEEKTSGMYDVTLQPQPNETLQAVVWQPVEQSGKGSLQAAAFGFVVGGDNTFTANGIIVRGQTNKNAAAKAEEAQVVVPA